MPNLRNLSVKNFVAVTQRSGEVMAGIVNTANAAKDSLMQIVTSVASITDRNLQISSASEQYDGFLPEPVFIEYIAYNGDKSAKVVLLPNLPISRFFWLELFQCHWRPVIPDHLILIGF